MAKRTVYHVTHEDRKWKVTKEGAERASATAETKEAAVERAIELAQQRPSQVKIHKQDGTLQSERTYGQDPEKHPG
jgi:uncharacterized protein YdaT